MCMGRPADRADVAKSLRKSWGGELVVIAVRICDAGPADGVFDGDPDPGG